MASSINASTSGAGGVITTADNTGILNIQTAGTTAVTVDASQNVGIGTASPAAKFQVNGAIRTTFSGDTNYYGTFNNATGAVQVYANGDSAPLLFGTTSNGGSTATERMRIDASGNVLVGTTRNDYGTLAVFNNAATFATNQAIGYFKSTQSGDVGQAGIYVAKFDNNSTTSQILIKFAINNAGNGQGQINANGGGAAAFGSFSDVRLKENIVDLPNQLENIAALRPVEFDYKDGSGHQIGFIAQEMQEVYADTVSESSDGMLTITGWSKTEARLVKAIQEQQTIINDLKARITALEGAA